MQAIKIKDLKPGSYFKRKPEAKKEYIREHFNRADSFGPASICCTDSEDIGRSIQLNPNKIVYVERVAL